MVEEYKKLHWTEHSKIKMKQYGLSKTKLISLLYKPERKEKGIVPGTTAVMKPNKMYLGQQKNKTILRQNYKRARAPGEVWLMYQDIKNKSVRKIISAWRYPGISKAGQEIPIPEEIRQELLNDGIK